MDLGVLIFYLSIGQMIKKSTKIVNYKIIIVNLLDYGP